MRKYQEFKIRLKCRVLNWMFSPMITFNADEFIKLFSRPTKPNNTDSMRTGEGDV